MATTFIAGRFERLHTLVRSAAANPARVATENEWYLELDRHRLALADFARAKPPSEAERKELEGGNIILDGKSYPYPAEYAQLALPLARELNVSERYAASVLRAGQEAATRLQRPSVEAACVLYHTERQAASACLLELVRNARTLEAEEDAAARAVGGRMAQLVLELLNVETEVAGRKVKLAERILLEIDAVKQSIAKLTATTNAPAAMERLESMLQERRQLGHLLYLIASARSLAQQPTLAVVQWLSTQMDASDALVTYVLTALLAALDPESALETLYEEAFLMQLHTAITTKPWSLEAMQSVVMLQWSLVIVEPGVARTLRISEDVISAIALGSMAGPAAVPASGSAGSISGGAGSVVAHGDAFPFLILHVLSFKQRAIDAVDGEDQLGDADVVQSSTVNADGDVDVEFQEYIYVQVQDLILRVVTALLPALKRIQRIEEDAEHAPSRSRPGAPTPERSFDIEALFDVITLLCRGRPDAGLAFWMDAEGKETRFIPWAVDLRTDSHRRGAIDMLAALATGTQSAWRAHELLSKSGSSSEGAFISWARMFEWIQYYVDIYTAPQQPNARIDAMAAVERRMLTGFFRLLRNVTFYSTAAREALYQHTIGYTVVPRMFALYTCPAPPSLKAALLDALVGFAQPTGDMAARIVSDLWKHLERCDALGLRAALRAAPRIAAQPGAGGMFGLAPQTTALPKTSAASDLEQVEAHSRHYLGTTSFVNFLASLIHMPPRAKDPAALLVESAKDNSLALLSRNLSAFTKMVLGLGQGHRAPGLDPYVSFVIDTVLLQMPNRELANPADAWRIKAACLGFIERCLVSYDLDDLQQLGGGGVDREIKDSQRAELLTVLLLHPGFNIMKRLLTKTPLLRELLSIIAPADDSGFESINARRPKVVFQATCVRLSLRIVQHVLRKQDAFLQVLLPLLADPAASGINSQALVVEVPARVGPSGAYGSMDLHLLHDHRAVVQIGLYINAQREDVALLAVRLLGLIARSNAFGALDRFGEMGYGRKMNRLVGLFDMMNESDRIRAACVDRLEADPGASETSLEVLALHAGVEEDTHTGAEFEGLVAPPADAGEALRLAILDLLLVNTVPGVQAPNIAHLILGFDLRASASAEEQIIPDPDSPETERGALHSILALLRPGEPGVIPLAERSPALAEKCHALIAQLCRHSFTSAATMRYLRTREDFFTQQLRTLPLVPAEQYLGENLHGVCVYPGKGRVETTITALISSLHMRTCLLEGVALELHTLANAGMAAPASRLLAALFGSSAVEGSAHLNDDEDEEIGMFANKGVPEQRGLFMLELLQSLDFRFSDDRDELGNLVDPNTSRWISAARIDPALGSAREYDIEQAILRLSDQRAKMERAGEIKDAAGRAGFERNALLLLSVASARNSHKLIAIARRSAMQAWRHTLDMVLTRVSTLLRPEARASIIFDCLGALLPRLSGSGLDDDPGVTDLIAGAALGLLTSLRQHRASLAASAALAEGADDLPLDRLVSTLRALLDAITRPGTSILARGNLYSALINYLQLVRSVPGEAEGEDGGNLSLDGGSVADFDDGASAGGWSSVGSQNGSVAHVSVPEARTRALIATQLDRLVPILARDALDAIDIWRTVVFTLCDKLCALEAPMTKSGRSAQPAQTLDILGRQGFLKTFVAGLRDMDVALQEILRPDPSSLNALYVYGAQMAFFNRLALSRAGAERLLDARIFEVLAQADYIAARPEQDQDFIDQDSFLPAAMERYDALLTPALQLCVSLLSSTSTRQSKGVAITSFGSSQRPQAAFGTAASAAPRQALALIESHSNTFLTVLKAPSQPNTSLSAISQAQLIVSMLVFILPMLDDDALLPTGPLASFHSAVLALAADFLYSAAWRGRVLPQTDVEHDDATRKVAAPLYVNGDEADEETLFDTHTRRAVETLVASLLAYLELASETRGRLATTEATPRLRVRPCLTASMQAPAGRRTTDDAGDDNMNNLTVSRLGGQTGYRAAASVPGIGTALAALEEYVDGLRADLKSIDMAENMLENADDVALQEWDEIIRDTIDEVDHNLGPAQRRSLAIRELKQRRFALRSSVLSKLDGIEILLVLLYRHFDYYLWLPTAAATMLNASRGTVPDDSRRFGPTLFSASALASTRGREGAITSAGVDAEYLVREGMDALERILPRLEGSAIALPESKIARARERASFLEMAGRRLVGVLQAKDAEFATGDEDNMMG